MQQLMKSATNSIENIVSCGQYNGTAWHSNQQTD